MRQEKMDLYQFLHIWKITNNLKENINGYEVSKTFIIFHEIN